MAKWKIGATASNSTTFYVTFTANTALTGYRVVAYSVGRDAATAGAFAVAFENVANDSGTTATLYCGAPSSTGDCMMFPEDGFLVRADRNAFATVTWAAPATGSLAVAYFPIYK